MEFRQRKYYRSLSVHLGGKPGGHIVFMD